MLCLVAQLCPALCDPMDCSPLEFCSLELLQARILEWVAMSSFKESSQPRDWTQVSYFACRFFIIWAIGKSLIYFISGSIHPLTVLTHSVVSNSVSPWTVTCQAPVSMGILQARTLERVAMPSSRESSQSRDWAQVSCIVDSYFTTWATLHNAHIFLSL